MRLDLSIDWIVKSGQNGVRSKCEFAVHCVFVFTTITVPC